MTMTLQVAKRKMYGSLTQTAGTVITRLVEPVKGCVTTLSNIRYLGPQTTQHTLTVLRPLGMTTVASAAAAAQKVINITNDPGVYSAYGVVDVADNVIAASDFCVYQTKDGTYTVDTVASVASLAITMTTNVPTSTVAAGAPFWWFGVIGDTNPNDGLVHATLLPQICASAALQLTAYGDGGEALSGLFASIIPDPAMRALKSSTLGQWPLNGRFEPIIVQSSNGTTAGFLEAVEAVYTLLA